MGVFLGVVYRKSYLGLTEMSCGHVVLRQLLTFTSIALRPMYQSELCRKDWRGRIVSWEIWFIGGGIVLSYVSIGFPSARAERT